MTTQISWKYCVIANIFIYYWVFSHRIIVPLTRINVDKFLCNVIFTLRRQSAVKTQCFLFTHIVSSAYFAGNLTFIWIFYIIRILTVYTFIVLKTDYALLTTRTVRTIAQRGLLYPNNTGYFTYRNVVHVSRPIFLLIVIALVWLRFRKLCLPYGNTSALFNKTTQTK